MKGKGPELRSELRGGPGSHSQAREGLRERKGCGAPREGRPGREGWGGTAPEQQGPPCRPLHCGQRPPGTAEDRPGPGASGAQRPWTPRQGCAWPRPVPTAVAARPGQAASIPAPTLHAAGAQTTRVHTVHPRSCDRLRLPGVMITADRGLQSRRPRPLALHLRRSTQGLGLGPAGRRRPLGVLPVHAGGTREPGADGTVGTRACDSAEETVERNAKCA